jgi:predicted outer membrane repeat protein
MGHEHMLRRIAARIAFAGAGALAATSLYAVPAEATTSDVRCSATALASAVGSATSGETLNLAAYCTYRLTAALPTVGQDLTILGNHATLLRSYALATPAFTILSVDAGTLAVTDLNFTNGEGAIAATENASITVQGGSFTRNHAANGGAINSTTGMGSLTVTDAVFNGNSATQAGGAIYTNEADGMTTVTGCRFAKNKAGTIGGGIYNFFDMSVSGSTFDANEAEDGGAIFNNAVDGDSLTNVTIDHNRATQDGGGIFTTTCFLSLASSRIFDNQAGVDGGGLYQYTLMNYPDGLTLTRSSVRGNAAQNGAGIYGYETVTSLEDSTVLGNAASGRGGGIYNDGLAISFGNLNLDNSKISRNRAGTLGGGIYNTQGTVDAAGSPIEHNGAVTGGGGIFDGPGPNTVSLTNSPVQFNRPDNCEPTGTIPGCTDGPSAGQTYVSAEPVRQGSRHRDRMRPPAHVPWQRWRCVVPPTAAGRGHCRPS